MAWIIRWRIESLGGVRAHMSRIVKIVLATLLVVAAALVLRAYYFSRTRSAVISEETKRGLKRIDEQPASEAGLQERLNSYFGALLEGKQRVTIDMMDPRFFPSRQAQLEAVTLLEKSTTTFSYYSITNGHSFGHFKGSNSLHCFVPYVSDGQIGTQRATVKSYLLATRYDGSNTWFFVDIGTKGRAVLAKYYDNLPDELPKASLEKKE